jgi:hypothetical protein
MERVARTTNESEPMMSRYNLPVDSTSMMTTGKAKNNTLKEQQYQSLYKPVHGDPWVNGKASIKLASTNNYVGINHFEPTPTTQLYNVGLKTGGGRDVLPPLIPPKTYSM